MKNFEFLLTAYLAVWGIFLVFEFVVSSRVSSLEKELRRLRAELERKD